MSAYLSVVIPAFNEADRIEETLHSIEKYIEQQKLSTEIVVVDDGSTDDTAALVKRVADQISILRLVELRANHGKGAAVRAGMLDARGEALLFMDADGSTAIEELGKLLPYITRGFDVVVGSRLVAGALKKTKQSATREFLGWIFRALVHVLVPTDIDRKSTRLNSSH